jgi:hypothetical protein
MIVMNSSRCFPRRLTCALLCTTLVVQSISCGTILYPERIGQPRGPLDPKVVALDTAGLLLFFVPGAIAFGVDFYNGTIYLPPPEYRCQSPDEIPPERWISQKLDSDIDTPEELQKYLQRQTGQTIELKDDQVKIIPLDAAPTWAPVPMRESSKQSTAEGFDWKKFFRLGQSSKKPRS